MKRRHTWTILVVWTVSCLGAAACAGAQAGADPILRTAPQPPILPDAGLDSLRLARATYLLREGKPAAALRLLDAIDSSPATGFADAGRVVFLRAAVRLQTGDRSGFNGVVGAADLPADSPYQPLLTYLSLLVNRSLPTDFGALPAYLRPIPGAGVIAATRLLAAGERSAAAAALAAGEPGPAFTAHERYLQYVLNADSTAARAQLQILRPDPGAASARRGEDLRAAVAATERADWELARRKAEATVASWRQESEWLAGLATTAGADQAWRLWTEVLPRADELPHPEWDWTGGLAREITRATDLTRSAAAVVSDWPPAAGTGHAGSDRLAAYAQTHHPDKEHWRRWDDLAQLTHTAVSEQRRQEQALLLLQARRDRQVDYIGQGRRLTEDHLQDLHRAMARLDSLLVRLDRAESALEQTRADALRHFARRARTMADELETNLLFARAVRHFQAQGPGAVPTGDWPGDVPTPSEVLDAEIALAADITQFLTVFNATVPERVTRSCREIWIPRLSGGGGLRAELAGQVAQGKNLLAALEDGAQTMPITRRITAARARLEQQQTQVDSLRHGQGQLKDLILTEVMAAGRKQLRDSRESIDYVQGNALYWEAVAGGPATTEKARSELRNFLQNYPNTKSRAECRYRLADLELLRARAEFQARMAGFLDSEPTADDLHNQALAPFVDYAPAVRLYEQILTEDADFAHRPAVLYQLGMILSDAGEERARDYLDELVSTFPSSPFNQAAWLRLGDEPFARRAFADCLPYYAEAAAGDDISLRAVALYKLGWARFELDDFTGAADAFGSLLDQSAALAESAPGHVARRTDRDLAGEAREYLVHALIRAGGVEAFSAHFERVGPRDYQPEILLAMGHQLSRVSLFDQAIACDRLWLEEYGDGPQAIAVARRVVAGYQRWHRPDQARQAHLNLARRFLPDTGWYQDRADSTARDEAREFAGTAFRQAAVHDHRLARDTGQDADWRRALSRYEEYLQYWPAADDAPRLHLQAGEAAFKLLMYPDALVHFQFAAAHGHAVTDSLDLGREADWQAVAVRDAWYGRDRGRFAAAATTADSLARRLLDQIATYQKRHPKDERRPDLLWRSGQVAYDQKWYAEAARPLTALGREYPQDSRAATALRMAGDAHYRRLDFAAAGASYEQALDLARSAADDSLRNLIAPLIPRCYFQHAEQTAARDSTGGPLLAAPLFAAVAARWPDFDAADLALYRSGLGYASGQEIGPATHAWQSLLANYPASDYARDSALQIAAVNEAAGLNSLAAAALADFSVRFASDPEAATALLRASDLLVAAGDSTGAETLKTDFLARFAGETETIMSIREARATRALLVLAPDQDPHHDAEVQAYLALAAAHPRWAAPEILAEVDFRVAERARRDYLALALDQPLAPAVQAKQASLTRLLTLYEASARHGVLQYTRAAAFRMGEVITQFGDALLASERPAELKGDDLLAYEEVLTEQSWPFYDRGEAAWTELLREANTEAADPGQWLQRARQELWPRLAERFAHLPSAAYPVLAAEPPAAISDAAGDTGQSTRDSRRQGES